ncbi:Uncharacterised protein [Acinetobacter baumannii]|nr:Uncharacterised protein [Acinetobacter baumannii]
MLMLLKHLMFQQLGNYVLNLYLVLLKHQLVKKHLLAMKIVLKHSTKLSG